MDQEVRTAAPAPGLRHAGAAVPTGIRRVVGARELPSAAGTARFAAVTAQLALVLLALHLFRIEESVGFGKLLPLIFGGFVLHALLPLRLRRPFFLALSLTAIGLVFGPLYGGMLIALGLTLVGLCHLPVRFGARVALIGAAAAGLAALRLEWVPSPAEHLPTLVLPILGSMFMFRLAIYLYDLRHERVPATWAERLSYFFLLPNICFPLFPVVDYQTYRRTYYDSPAHEIYQKGVLWMLRGLMQLVAYRVVYHYLVPASAEVQGLGGMVQSMLSTYLLYLRISGQFHLIVGILCLFGFNLPETHRLYLLASSFNDYWRRINIYWKDFMMKLFYYPSLMYLRRWGMEAGMVGATLVVFAGTWLLHSYQWLWLRGTFPVTGPDALFWGILGLLVVANSLHEAKRGRRRTLAKPGWSLRGALVHALKTTGMLVFITVLWSLWSSHSVGEWLTLVGAARQSSPGAVGLLLAALALLVSVGVLVQYALHRGWPLSPLGERPSFRRSAAFSGATALGLVLIGLPQVNGRLGTRLPELVASVQENRLNVRDAETLERGYYEGLLGGESYTSALWRVSPQRQPGDWQGVREAGGVHWTHDLLEFELRPSFATTIKRVGFSTNQWGMRDREYTLEKPAGTYRMALLGSSHAMGAGVADGQTFETLVESRLNEEQGGRGAVAYEILNFAVAGYTAHQSAIQLERSVARFSPDAVLYAAHANEASRMVRRLARAVEAGVPIGYPELAALVERSGARPGMRAAEIERRLYTVEDDLLGWSFRSMVETARAHGAVPVWVYVPVPGEREEASRAQLHRLAEAAGFEAWSLAGAFDGHDAGQVQLAAWDSHPNAKGHTLLAAQLHARIRENLPRLLSHGATAR
jgi:D-alanyl-lipoteichoic acid acyltransferase DltB (MBOAT superfamily)